MKKGQSMSINVIIVAALALIVLVILIAIFTGRISVFSGEINTAELDAKARAANIAKSTCDGTCFTAVKYENDAATADLIGVTGKKSTVACTGDLRNQAGSFTDIGQGGYCCVTAKPTSSQCSP